jgi:tRNA threonylcarbamoyladenosine biosynthesis protein TsaB
MHILAIETTGPHCSVAIIDETGKVKEAASKGTMNHLQYLMPLTRQLLQDSQLQLDDIKAIAVSAGPGSFTGIRIGVSSARGLAQVLGCQVIPVETLKAFAYHDPDFDGLICPIFDARRNQIYGGAFAWKDGEIVEAVPGGPYMLDEYLLLLESAIAAFGQEVKPSSESTPSGPTLRVDRVRFFGDGLKPYGQKVEAWASGQPIEFTVAPEEHRYQEAASVAKLGLLEHQKGNGRAYETVFPNYMRKAEAQKNLEDRLAKEAATQTSAAEPCEVEPSEARHE